MTRMMSGIGVINKLINYKGVKMDIGSRHTSIGIANYTKKHFKGWTIVGAFVDQNNYVILELQKGLVTKHALLLSDTGANGVGFIEACEVAV